MDERTKIIDGFKEMCKPPVPDQSSDIIYKVLNSFPIDDSDSEEELENFFAADLSNIEEDFIKYDIKKIGDGLFTSTTLQNVTIPESITEIGDYAFFSSSTLKNIVFLGNIEKIGYKSFQALNSLQYIDFSHNKTIPELLYGSDAFGGLKNTAKIVVPDNLYDELIVTPGWDEWYSHNYIIKASDKPEV